MAKKKKGPAADALAALEALEMEENATAPVEEPQTPPAPNLKKAKTKKKKGAKGPAADALAALEELEAEGGCHVLVEGFVPGSVLCLFELGLVAFAPAFIGCRTSCTGRR